MPSRIADTHYGTHRYDAPRPATVTVAAPIPKESKPLEALKAHNKKLLDEADRAVKTKRAKKGP